MTLYTVSYLTKVSYRMKLMIVVLLVACVMEVQSCNGENSRKEIRVTNAGTCYIFVHGEPIDE